ncbi:MAG TPA: D-alanyl-D-alanine carboxypeptidase [Stellaceae bacterium]|jgi:D-alanyl-D-alanine carboxypeptidase|nr:D-alanyl-D-alanine carboxypeptidase [Stellaceae bacterium]
MSPEAQAKYASIIIDADTGEVLHEVNPDGMNYPASLTKMMTLYLAFEALDNGQLKLDQKLPVSTHAASRAPSKLGLIPGDSVAVRDLILALVTKSANDAASVVAEGLGGSENAFAERMTQKAHKLGMKNTVFHNASGLPDLLNRTTARDLATLARALYRDFPDHYHYFSTREFVYHGTVHANHNHLMSSFQGMDGIKTGYINASGFNLAASAKRDNRRLIGVVMGGESARTRDAHMAQLLNDAFASRRSDVMVAKAEEPADAEVTPAAPAKHGIAARAVSALSPVSRAEAAPLVSASGTGTLRKAGERVNRLQHWSVQLGAFSHHAAAEKAVASVTKLPVAKGKPVVILDPGKTDTERLYRARLVNFTKQEANAVCSSLHKHHLKCSVVAPLDRS